MKRILSLLMVPVLVLCLSACGQREQSPPKQEDQSEGNKNKGYLIYINEDSPKKFVMYSVDMEGKEKKKVTDKNPYDAAGYGPKIAFLSDVTKKQSLSMINGDGSGLTPIMTDCPDGTGSLSWSPDRMRVAFTAKSGSGNRVYYVEAGKFMTPVPVGNSSSINTSPVFSDDGRMIIYSRDMGGNFDIFKYTISSKTEVNLSNNNPNDISPVTAPDGTKILFLSDESSKGQYNLYMMNIDGTGRTALTTGMNIEEGSIRIAPDSGMVSFVALSGKGNKAIHIVNMQKSLILAANGGYLSAWSSDGTKLYFASSDSKSRRIVEYEISGGTTKDVLSIELKPGEESEGIKLLHYTDSLK